MLGVKIMEIEEYLDLLTEANSKAGGGSVASVNGATTCSLILKAYNLIKARLDKDIKQKLPQNFYNDLLNKRDFFEEMILHDGDAFQAVLDAINLPKSTDEEKKIRNLELQKAYKIALESPLKVMLNLVNLFEYASTIKKHTDSLLRTELEIAMYQLIAGVKSAKILVLINARYIDDYKYVNNITVKINVLEEQVNRISNLLDNK